MSLEQLTDRAIRTRRLDRDTAQRIHRFMDRASQLTPEEYEALRRLGRALRSGDVETEPEERGAGHA